MRGKRLRRLFHLDRFDKRLEASLEEEVEFHLEARIQGFVREGFSKEEARKRALSQFGDPQAVLERCRRIDERSAQRRALSEWLKDLGQDVRIALRGLAKTRGFTVVSVLSLACGIGAFVAFFTLTHATALRPVPGVDGADRAVDILMTQRGGASAYWDFPDFHDLQNASTPLQDVAAWKYREGNLTTDGGGEKVALAYVSSDYFRVLGVTPVLGRPFLESEDVGAGQHPVAVVSYDMWQDRLGGDPEIIGSSVTLNRRSYTIVGAAPEDFKGHLAIGTGRDFWLPLVQHPWMASDGPWVDDRDGMWLQVLGRLRGGAALGEANAAMETVFSRLEEEYPETNEARGAKAYPFGPIPAEYRAESTLLIGLGFGLMSIVLLIICGNVAGMVLARSVTREQEIAVRLALGAGRMRLARLLLVEALLIAVAGGGFGLLLGRWSLDLAFSYFPDVPEIALGAGAPVVPFALAVTLVATLAVGLLPSIRFSRPELVSSLKDDSGGGGRRVGRIHRFSASSQAGLALTLLVTSGLFLRSLGVLERKNLGFEPTGLYIANIHLSHEGMETLELAEPFLDRVREGLEGSPGVTAVSIANGIPLDLSGNFTGVSRGDQPDPSSGRIQVEFTLVDEGFFETIGTPVIQGRGFQPSDNAASELVMVISESLAHRLWPGEDALGRQAWSGMIGEGPRRFTIVGVVPEVASSRPTENWPNIFVPYRQVFYPRTLVAVRSEGDPSTVARGIQSTLLGIEPDLTFPMVVGSESLVERGAGSQRFSAKAAGGLGLLALLLAAIGVYGVVAFAVSSRTREIGLRMAMGATRGEVMRQVLKDGVRLALPGLFFGGLVAVALAMALQAEFFGLSPLDPVSFLSAGGVLFLVVLLASVAPARKASGIDPMRALRME